MNLGLVLSAYMRQEKVSLRKVALQMGISHHNLHRIVKGENTRADNALKVITWLMNEPSSNSHVRHS